MTHWKQHETLPHTATAEHRNGHPILEYRAGWNGNGYEARVTVNGGAGWIPLGVHDSLAAAQARCERHAASGR